MKRIIIQLSEVSRKNWGLIYRFIERCLGNEDYSEDEFVTLKKKGINIGIDERPLQRDVCSISDVGIKELRYEELPQLGDYVFNIIYVKADESEEFSDYVRFFLLKMKYKDRLTLGINLDVFKDVKSLQKYRFQLANFFLFIKDKSPHLGTHSLYLIMMDSGGKLRASSIPFKGEGSLPDYNRASPFLFPLMPINTSFFSVFENTDVPENELGLYIEHSLDNIQKRLEKKRRTIIDIDDCDTLLEKWFISSFYLSLSDEGVERIDEWKPAVIELCHNIYELAQNILFHTQEKQGLFFAVVNKKERVSNALRACIPGFEEYDDYSRFVEYGVYDYGDKGIVRTYYGDGDVYLHNRRLSDFYTLSWLNQLSFNRKSEHLGLRSFVDTIKDYKGYFRVESNNPDQKKDIVENAQGSVFKEQLGVDNVSGTHYDVVIPVIPSKNEVETDEEGMSFLRSNLRNVLKESQMNLPLYKMIQQKSLNKLVACDIKDKKGQEAIIEETAKELLEEIYNTTPCGGVAINMECIELRENVFYKLLEDIIVINKEKGYFGKGFSFIFTNLKSGIIDKICAFFYNDIESIFDEEYMLPIVLMGKQWRIQLLYGKDKDELLYANERIHSLFSSKDFFERKAFSGRSLLKWEKSNVDAVILPYDLMIDEGNGETYFTSCVNDALDTPIDNDRHAIGCKVAFPTKIGSKIYVENYYEADFLFLNNFFTDRFAYFVAKEIVERIKNENADVNGKQLVLIGYNPYSTPLTERVKDYVNDVCPDTVSDIIIAKQTDRDNEIVFKMSKEQALNFIDKKDNYGFITIVPIASTLSTSEKIISLFRRRIGNLIWDREERSSLFPLHSEIPELRFVFHHVTILVRDENSNTVTKREEARNWKSIHNYTIHTTYHQFDKTKDGMSISFLIQKTGNWRNLINSETFPQDWWKEIYINQTQKASINTQELHGIPVAALPSLTEMKREISDYEKAEDDIEDDTDVNVVWNKYYALSELRLSEMRDFVYSGHLRHNRYHFSYYFDIERLFETYRKHLYPSSQIKSPTQSAFVELTKWLNCVKTRVEEYRKDSLNVIITPDHESCYVSTINEIVFDNNAFVVYLNNENSVRDNAIKLDYLRDWHKNQQPHYYFVDQALFSGRSYQKAKNCMIAILNDDTFIFDGIITIINKLSNEHNKSITSSLNSQLVFSFLYFYAMPSNGSETDCGLCGLSKMYENLKSYSAIEDCRKEIERNRRKFVIQELGNYLGEERFEDRFETEGDIMRRKVSTNPRYWSRMIWRHRLFYELAKPEVKGELCGVLSSIYKKDCVSLDDKISFLKVITFPPLSQYSRIRAFAHGLQLEELHDLLSKSQPNSNDFRLMEVYLKHLSILGSNAIVRRDVILKSWKLYSYVAEHNQEWSQKKRNEFIPKFIFYIKLASYKDEAKSLWLGELLRKGSAEMNPEVFSSDYKVAKTRLYNQLWYHFSTPDFKNIVLPFLFYDNTAITRKTLDNLEFAIDKDTILKTLLKGDEGSDKKGRLRPFNEILSVGNDIVARYKDMIDHEYYYSWFRHFIDNNSMTPDGIPLLEKFVYVLYERLLLKNLVDTNIQNDKPFDQNAKDLLEVATKVMGADAAFIYVKDNRDRLFNLASHGVVFEIKDFRSFYFRHLLFEEDSSRVGQPFVMRKVLIDEGERFLNDKKQFNRATYLMLNRAKSKKEASPEATQGSLIGVVAFLYYDEALDNSSSDAKKQNANDRFMKNAQESGRLLLLLKPQIDEYVKHVADEKQFEVWKEKQKYIDKYNTVFGQSRHAFGDLVIPDLDNLDSYERVPYTFYRQANNIITNIYAEFVNNINYKLEEKYLKDIPLSVVLEKKFEALLLSFDKWEKDLRGKISKPVFDYDSGLDPQGLSVHTNKFILQSFVFLCMHNAFMHYRSSKKTVRIRISQEKSDVSIRIINDFPQMSLEEFNEKKGSFDKLINVSSWQSIFEDFGNAITISTIKKCYEKSGFCFFQEKQDEGFLYGFEARISLPIVSANKSD